MLEDYEMGVEIGHGGMSVVNRAVRRSDRRPVALKFFVGQDSGYRTELTAKFIQESKLLATFEHPNLVKVFDFGVKGDDSPWLAMELVEGAAGGSATLAARLSAARPLTPREVIGLYQQLRAALAYCHARGVVHGDVKAENVLLTVDGTAKLSDFGISRVLNPVTRVACDLTTATLDGNLGTPYVRAPECREGEKATPASDVYSFGVLLFKCVTGVWYEGSRRLLREARRFAPEWAPLLERMLAVDPRQRIPSAEKLPLDPCAEGRRRLRLRRFAIAACFMVTTLAVVALAQSILRAGPSLVQASTEVPRRMTDLEWGRYYFGTNAFDYVPEATLTRTNRLALTRPIMYGNLHLPDTNGVIEVEAPPGYDGFLVLARKTDGDLFSQFHVRRVGKLRVRASVNSIRVANGPFPARNIPDGARRMDH